MISPNDLSRPSFDLDVSEELDSIQSSAMDERKGPPSLPDLSPLTEESNFPSGETYIRAFSPGAEEITYPYRPIPILELPSSRKERLASDIGGSLPFKKRKVIINTTAENCQSTTLMQNYVFHNRSY